MVDKKRLIEQIEKKVIWRLLEDAETDHMMRDQAINVLENLIEYLKSDGDLRVEVGGFDGFYVYLKDFSEYEQRTKNPLKIVFSTYEMTKETPLYSSHKGMIVIPVFEDNPGIVPKKQHKTKIYRSLEREYYRSFVHEYIHYLDDIRTELNLDDLAKYDIEGVLSSGKSINLDNAAVRDYFSDPLEVNAFFQQAMAFIHQIAKDRGPLFKSYKKQWNNDFRKFKSWFFDQELNKYTRQSIDRGQYKRLVNRLYGFFENYIKE